MLHVPWLRPTPAQDKSHALIDALNDRLAFLQLARRRHALQNPARRDTSSGAHP